MALSKEDQFRRILMELRLMEGSAQTLNSRLQLLTTALGDLRLAQQSLRDLKDVEADTPLLVPVGGGALVNAQLGDLSKVVMGIGARVSVEMDLEEAIENVNERIAEIEKAQGSVQQQLMQILAQIEAHQERANRLSAELQGEAVV
jgi:prefoldin alpha subunit